MNIIEKLAKQVNAKRYTPIAAFSGFVGPEHRKASEVFEKYTEERFKALGWDTEDVVICCSELVSELVPSKYEVIVDDHISDYQPFALKIGETK